MSTINFQQQCRELVYKHVYCAAHWALSFIEQIRSEGDLDDLPWSETEVLKAYKALQDWEVEIPESVIASLGEDTTWEEGTNTLAWPEVVELKAQLESLLERKQEELEGLQERIEELDDDLEVELLPPEQHAREKALVEAEAKAAESLIKDIEQVIDELSGEAYSERSPFECWIVSPWLGTKLREQGCAVVDAGNQGDWWLRTTSGQAIAMDGVIAAITKAELGDEG